MTNNYFKNLGKRSRTRSRGGQQVRRDDVQRAGDHRKRARKSG